MKVEELLRQNGVWFEAIPHRTTFTAQRTAEAVHVTGDEVAKTVVLKADDRYVLAVLQATRNVDLERARTALGVKATRLATERELATLFPDCELGALPPFGSRYGLTTLVDEPLTHDAQVVIEGNSHDMAIRMNYADFARLERPRVAAFSYHN